MDGAKETSAKYWKWILLLFLLLVGVAKYRHVLSHKRDASNEEPSSNSDLVSDGRGKFTILTFQPNSAQSARANVQRPRRNHPSSAVELSVGPAEEHVAGAHGLEARYAFLDPKAEREEASMLQVGDKVVMTLSQGDDNMHRSKSHEAAANKESAPPAVSASHPAEAKPITEASAHEEKASPAVDATQPAADSKSDMNSGRISATIHASPTAHAPLPHSSEMQNIAFLVRTYNPSEENAKMVAQWFSDLRSSPNVHTFVSIDQTNPGHEEHVRFLIDRLLASGFHVSNIHRYTEDDMRREYPALTGKEVLGSLAWGYHIQAIDLWMQTLPQKDQTYEHLWTLEDDIGYTGDISRLLHKYSRNSADLIGGTAHIIANKTWKEMAPSELYMQKLNDTAADRLGFEEHCTRMSAKLLGRLHAWSAAGALDWSESMPVTICHKETMECATLQADDVGKPYSYNGVITKTQWQTVERNDSSAGQPRLYHALKF